MVEARVAGCTTGKVVQLGIARRLEFRQAKRITAIERPVRRLAGHRREDVLGENALTEDDLEGNRNPFLPELGLNAQE